MGEPWQLMPDILKQPLPVEPVEWGHLLSSKLQESYASYLNYTFPKSELKNAFHH